jgi:L-threonylcarbamoyladenylate synthase
MAAFLIEQYTNNNLKCASKDSMMIAAETIQAGGLVAFPTETVYGLGADATNSDAVACIFKVKKRPDFNPLIIHFSNQNSLSNTVVFNEPAKKLARAFWPGALTMVLPRKSDCAVSLLASAGLDTLAVRIPNHPLANTLITAANTPIAAPSANFSGEISPSTAQHVLQSLGDKVDVILDGGPCKVGIESTVIDLSGSTPTLLRPGGIVREDLEEVIGPIVLSDGSKNKNRSPGMLKRHYAPTIPLRLNAEKANPGEAFLAFGSTVNTRHLNLSRMGDLKEAAANLFSMLRKLDQPNFRGIAVMKIPATGLGVAINDRLKRAATVS